MPYWRLSAFYLFYFAALGALIPYWGLYLQSQGFNAVAIGVLMSLLMATKIIAPNIWGWLGDHLGHRMRIVRLASLASILIFTTMFWAEGFWAIALSMALFSFFWNASLPQFEVVTFTYLGAHIRKYARIRLWGSLGFILAVVILGLWVDSQGPRVVLFAVLLMYLGIWGSSLAVKDPAPEPHPEDQPSILTTLKEPSILAFFAAIFLMQMGHGTYYAFYSIYLDDYGYSKSLIGQLWAIGVIGEVLVFLIMHRILTRWGGRAILMASLLIAALRWLLIGAFPDSLLLMIIAQLLHAATFGTFHASAIHLVHHYFPGRYKGRGQALYSSISFGAGGAVGSLISGLTWEHFGPGVSYSVAAGVSLLGAIIVWRFIDVQHDY